jgi:parvulin-like peptidyl-prolyl isomerase
MIPRTALLALTIFSCTSLLPAQTSPPAKSESSKPPVAIATVDGETIFSDEAELALSQALRGRKLDEAALGQLKAQALEQLIGQRLIVARLKRQGEAAPAAEIAAAESQLKAQSEREKRPWATFLRYRGYTPAALEHQLQWRIGWRNWLDKQLTDEALKGRFSRHAAEYDGRQLRVRHILWGLPQTASLDQLQAKIQEAEQVRRRLAAKELTFVDAVKQYSTGPSRAAGGALGFITRRGVMDEVF